MIFFNETGIFEFITSAYVEVTFVITTIIHS